MLNKIKSGTSDYFIPKDVYLFLFSELEKREEYALTFQVYNDESKWVQVVFDEEITVNFKYPYSKDPTLVIPEMGVTFPQGYRLGEWEKDTYAFFLGQPCPYIILARTVDELFTRLMKATVNYKVEGWITIL